MFFVSAKNAETVDHLFDNCRTTLKIYKQVAFRIANSGLKVQQAILDSEIDKTDKRIIEGEVQQEI
jgi:hypothetical protein